MDELTYNKFQNLQREIAGLRERLDFIEEKLNGKWLRELIEYEHWRLRSQERGKSE